MFLGGSSSCARPALEVALAVSSLHDATLCASMASTSTDVLGRGVEITLWL